MGWFRRKPSSPFPLDMADRLAMLGRFEFDHYNSGEDSTEIYPNCIAPFRSQVETDYTAFLADLLDFVKDDESGFVTYGASCLARELIHEDRLNSSADAMALLDAAIEVKRVRGLPSAFLKGYEWARWLAVNGPDTWPHGRRPPHPPV